MEFFVINIAGDSGSVNHSKSIKQQVKDRIFYYLLQVEKHEYNNYVYPHIHTYKIYMPMREYT